MMGVRHKGYLERARGIARRIVGALVVVMLVAGAAVAQQAGLRARPDASRLAGRIADGSAESTKAGSMPEKTVTVSIRNTVLVDALQAVAKSASVTLTYTNALANIKTRRTLIVRDMSLERALEKLLAGTGFRAKMVPPNVVVIMERDSRAEADSAVLRGRVVDSATQRPIVGAMISIRGSVMRTTTDERGTFMLRNLASGQQMVEVRRLGYSPFTKVVTLTTAQETQLVFILSATPSRLSEVVTTGSGERTKLEVGNSVATVNVDSIMQVTPVSSVSALLANRIPGLQTLSGSGAVGAPTRIRIRGISSIESSNGPIVIVDGIRVSTASTVGHNNTLYEGVVGGSGLPTGDNAGYSSTANDLSSRLDDIDPNTIESIEVMKGPAASTLYGSDAANGVIIIKTKRGVAGPPRWSLYADHTALVQPTDYDYPIEARGYPLRGGAALYVNCSLAALHNGTCVPIPGETIGFNMLKDSRFTPQTLGHNQSIGGNVSGGVTALQYFLGGTYLDQLGTAKLPNVNANWIVNARDGQPLSEEILRPNARNNASGTARLSGSLGGKSDFSVGATFASQYQRVGYDGMASLLGSGGGVPRLPTDTTPLSGFNNWNATRSQKIKHVTGNAHADWRPDWHGGDFFSANGTYGWDLAMTNDTYLVPRGSCAPLCTSDYDQGVLGFINTGRESDYTQTANVGTVLTLPLRSWLQSQTRVGGNYVANETNNLYGSNSDLLPGIGLFAAGGSANLQELGDFRGTVGWYLEQNMNLRQTLYLTMGLRKDAGSALGRTVTPLYPKWNASWIVSQEPFFPQRLSSIVSMLRLRFAYGRAGVMPSSTARIRSYELQTGYTNDDGSNTGYYAELQDPGNLTVRPERSAETEGGLDLELLDSRVTLSYTKYQKSTKDAIESNSLAPSLGVSSLSGAMLNVGDVDNRGSELEATVRIIDHSAISYSVSANVTGSANKLVRLAPGVTTASNTFGGNASLVVPGYPLFGRWAYPLQGWKDIDGNGLIDPAEVRIGDSLAYVGPSEATRTMYLSHTLGFLQNRVTFRANFSYSGGMTQFNQAREQSASYRSVIQGEGSLSLRDQACLVVASIEYTNERATDWCYMERIKVWRLQDLSMSVVTPQLVTRALRARSGTLTLTGTNLHLWTNYHGVDPNINTTPVTGNQATAGQAFPTPRTYGFRVQLTY